MPACLTTDSWSLCGLHTQVRHFMRSHCPSQDCMLHQNLSRSRKRFACLPIVWWLQAKYLGCTVEMGMSCGLRATVSIRRHSTSSHGVACMMCSTHQSCLPFTAPTTATSTAFSMLTLEQKLLLASSNILFPRYILNVCPTLPAALTTCRPAKLQPLLVSACVEVTLYSAFVAADLQPFFWVF